MNRLLKIAALAAVVLLGACTGVPEGLTPVKDFDGERYLGTWYEIARLDHSFERGLSKVSATYSRREDGGIRVLNRGFNSAEGEWSEAEGRAYFTQGPEVGALKVSFFGPFYSGYNVIAIDPDYTYALVAGASLKYLWILSRETSIPDDIKSKYLKIAQDIGYNVADLLWIEHNKRP